MSERAPSRLKARIYSALLRKQAESGPLRSVSRTEGLCVFEKAACRAPLGERAKSFNFCSICHARVLAEQIENPPIFWGNCPYVGFQNR